MGWKQWADSSQAVSWDWPQGGMLIHVRLKVPGNSVNKISVQSGYNSTTSPGDPPSLVRRAGDGPWKGVTRDGINFVDVNIYQNSMGPAVWGEARVGSRWLAHQRETQTGIAELDGLWLLGSVRRCGVAGHALYRGCRDWATIDPRSRSIARFYRYVWALATETGSLVCSQRIDASAFTAY